MRMVKAKLNGQFDLILPEHRAKRPEWTNGVGWEKPRLESMHQNIGKGDVVYYVGAELGEMSALCAVWGAEVVLFEPNWMAWASIKRTFIANKIKPLLCFAGFASNKTQLEPLNPDRALFNGRGYIIQEDGYPEYANGDIVEAHGFSELIHEADGLPQIKIDDMVASGVKPPTVLTMDVEGSEWEVLRGAEQTILKYHPKIWLSLHAEFMFDQYGEYSRDLRDWLIDRGYSETFIDWKHEAHFYYE
jgi:FkbM family methyltransferase